MKKLLSICFIVLTTTIFSQNNKAEFKNNATPGFLENKGQIADDKGNLRPDILFTTQSQGVRVFIGKQGLHYQFSKVDNPEVMEAMHKQMDDPSMELPEIKQTVYRLDVELVGANANPVILKENATGYFENYYLAHCPNGITGVKSYEKVVLKDVYQGIDWVFYRKGDYMKYDFVVHSGADANQIKLLFKGAENLQLNEDGSFTIKTPLGTITEEAPISYTKENQNDVVSKFILNDNTLSFAAESSPNQTLIIDPTLQWATYYGGVDSDQGTFCTTHINNVYLSGTTQSNSSIASGGHQNTYGGGFDSFLVKFNSSGIRQWATYYGGAGYEWGSSCAVDTNNNVYLVGQTSDTSSIASNGHQNTYGGGGNDAFLVKFNNMGVRQWATYYGGTGSDRANACAIDSNNDIYLYGITNSIASIASGGHQNTYGGGGFDSFLVKFNSSGIRQWATYYGGTGNEWGSSCTVDTNNNVYLVGYTYSLNAISFNGHQDTITGGADVFLVQLNSGGIRQWASYYGGVGNDYGTHCTIDLSNNIYFTGHTNSVASIAFGGHQNIYGGGVKDAFLVKFNSAGVRQWATYYGGTDQEYGLSCTVDTDNNAYFAGYTKSVNGISFNGHQNIYGGGNDAFLVKFNNMGVRQWATYYGGAGSDISSSCAGGINGSIYIAGLTASTSNISFNGHQNTYGGGSDLFLAKFSDFICTQTTNNINPTACNTYISPSGKVWTVSNTYLDTIPNVGGCDSVLTINLTVNSNNTSVNIQTACDTYTWVDGITYTANNNSATYTLINAAGCDSVVTLNLTLTYSNSGSENITACDNYIWSANATTYTVSGSYTAILPNVNGCDSIAALNLTIETIDNTVSQIGIVLTADATANNYQWVDCNNADAPLIGGTNQGYTPVVNGSYAVEISSANCTEISACMVINSIGIETLEELGIKIYPNPSNGKFTVEATSIAAIEIVNVMGAIVHQQTIAKGSNTVDVSSQPNGLYFISFTINEKVYTYRVVLEK